MADAIEIFSVRGIVRGYQMVPGQGALKEFFLADNDATEVPIRLRGVETPMRDGHDVEVFFRHDREADRDVPLLVCNYSIEKLEEVGPAPVDLPEDKPRNGPGCLAAVVAFFVIVGFAGLGFWPAFGIGLGLFFFIRKSPAKSVSGLRRRHDVRKALKSYIRTKYGRSIIFGEGAGDTFFPDHPVHEHDPIEPIGEPVGGAPRRPTRGYDDWDVRDIGTPPRQRPDAPQNADRGGPGRADSPGHGAGHRYGRRGPWERG